MQEAFEQNVIDIEAYACMHNSILARPYMEVQSIYNLGHG